MKTDTTETFAMISIEDLDLVNGGWAKEGLRNFGEWVGSGIDGAGMAVYNTGAAIGRGAVAGAKAISDAAVYASDSVRTGVANGCEWLRRGSQLRSSALPSVILGRARCACSVSRDDSRGAERAQLRL
jgi:hypothetical protein